MGSVYLARDITLDRPVAIKVINPDVSGNATLRSRFLQEARTVARLRHPNIVPVYAAGETDGMLYFVMEYVPGESLRDVLTREGALPAERAEQILRELALALHHANGQGLIHRDVKPENILLDADSGRAMLTDFGVARAVEQDSGMTQAGMILGSPKYMSPEQASGEASLDGRSDLYSLALVGYELCTGTAVVQSSTVAGMLVKHLTETPAPLASKVASLPPHVAAAIDRGLAKDPDERWQSGREFAEALAGGALTPSGELRGIGPPARRGLSRWIAGAAVAAVAALALWIGFGRGGTEGTGFLVAPFEIQSGDPGIAWLREGSVNMLTLTFAQWSDLNVVNYERTLSLLDAAGLGEKPRLSLDDALALAHRAGAGTVVTGQVQTTGDSLIVVARLFNAGSGQSARQAQVAAALGADPRPLFDQLAQLLLDIRESGRTSTMQLAQATTTSLEAYRAYLDGVRHLNAWRLYEADADFRRALALDSTFALAYHKRALGLGWSEAGGSAYLDAARQARALADRLPPRERALVEGHYHLSHALAAMVTGDTTSARSGYLAAIRSYGDLVAGGDSLSAEAWYGLADGYFHARDGIPGLPQDTVVAYTNHALRGFHRTLAIDSTFHLGYSHLVQLYSAVGQGSNLLIDADSTIMVDGPATVARLGGTAGVQRYRDAATRRGLEIAQAWARANTESTQPVLQLAQSYRIVGQPDSALAILSRALDRPPLAVPVLRLALLSAQLQVGDTTAAATLRHVLDHYTPDSLRTIVSGVRLELGGVLLSAAGELGRADDVQRAAELVVATDSTLMFTALATSSLIDRYAEALRMAMGAPMTPAARGALVARLRELGGLPGGPGQQMRFSLLSIPYLGFLVTRDTAFRSIFSEWNSGAPLTELDALVALSAGDTVTARRLAAEFPSPDSLRRPAIRFGVGGMRSVARAEVLSAVGLTRQAAETLEATDRDRINQTALVEPGYVIWVRSWLARARLWSQLDEHERARAAYEEFIRRWAQAEGVAAEEVRQARLELGRLTDAPPP